MEPDTRPMLSRFPVPRPMLPMLCDGYEVSVIYCGFRRCYGNLISITNGQVDFAKTSQASFLQKRFSHSSSIHFESRSAHIL